MAGIRKDQEDERIQLEIEMGLVDQVSALIAPMHISHEELITAFLKWCTDPDTQEEAVAWLRTALNSDSRSRRNHRT